MELFRLFGSVMIDDKDAINSLKKVDDKGKSTGQKFADVAKKGALIGAAVIGATAAAGGALLGMAKNTAEATDRIDKMSQKIGLSREGFQEWDFIMSQSGMSVDQLQMGFKTMVNAVDQAIAGTGKGADSFKKLGISVTDANGAVKDQETIFNEAVVALQGMEEGSEKAKLANDLFGRSGAEMMPLLNGAAGSIDEMKEKAHELGLVLSDDTVDAGVEFTDAMDQAQRALGAITAKVGAEVMPIVKSFLDWIIANMPTIQNVMSTVFSVISSVVKTATDIFTTYLLPTIMNVVGWIQANMPLMREVIGQVFDNIKNVWETTLKPVFDALMNVVKLAWDIFKVAWPHIMTIVGVAFQYIKQIWSSILQPTIMFIVDIVNHLVGVFQKHMPLISQIFGTMAKGFQGYYNTIIKPAIESIARMIGWMRDKFTEYILPLIDRVAGWFASLTDGIKSKMEVGVRNVTNAVERIKAVFDRIRAIKDNVVAQFEAIRTGIKSKIDAARDAVRSAIDRIKGFFNFSFKWPKIPMPKFGINPSGWKVGDLLKGSLPKLSVNWNADGGIFDKPTIFNTSAGLQGVGEAGPEAIMPLSKLESMLNLNNEKNGNDVIVNVNIDTFNNESDRDINALAEKLAFETNRRLNGGGMSFV